MARSGISGSKAPTLMRRATSSNFSVPTYLTSCFLGSRMLSSLSAYTFLEAVKRMICQNQKKRVSLTWHKLVNLPVWILVLPHRFETCVPETL